MATIQEQIEAIEKEIRETPYHKGTEHHIGLQRARLSKLKAKEIEVATRKTGGGGGYNVKKQGDATVILIGPPSVGKSTLITKLTNAKSKIAPYAFTTLTVIPGMMDYKDAKIQILDVPGIIGGAEKGKGRGKEVLSVARGADLIIIITDKEKLGQIQKIKESLYKNGIRLDVKPPAVNVVKKLRGNVVVHTNIKQDLDKETILDVAKEFGHKNAEIALKERVTLDRLIDAFAPNRVYAPSLVVINKVDDNSFDRSKVKGVENDKLITISAKESINLDELKEMIWNSLGFIRVYLVRRDEDPSYNNPLIIKSGIKLSDVALKIGTEFTEKKEAKIWGSGSKFPGQIVPLTRTVQDGMQIRFI